MSLRLRFAVLFALGVCACGGSTENNSKVTGGGGSGAVAGNGGGQNTGGIPNTGGTSSGGSGGFGGTPPPKVSKVDLLLMIDNSYSTAPQQSLFAEAIPMLLNQLLAPAADPTTGKPAYAPVRDLHIAIITSSLGGHGGNQCDPSDPNYIPSDFDNAHLLPSVRAGLASYQNLGFLWWDPTGTAANPPGESNVEQLILDFSAELNAVGANGCGYESQLEAWYRFLIDPNPPASVVNDGMLAIVTAPDPVILAQRNDFLRPDSAVAIVMLSDENDCSIKDGSQNWIAAETSQGGNPYYLPRSTATCAQNPDDPCCQSCASAAPNPGCPPFPANGCENPIYDEAGDPPSLRCFHQKQRFGIDFLQPVARYSEGLTQSVVHTDWLNGSPGGDVVPNPLFAGGRHPGLVFLLGIVGVPWQDLATDATLADPSALDFMDAEELAAKGRWQWFIPDNGVDQPDDPLMIESTTPRTGVNPATNSPLAPPTAPPGANPENGHEWLPDVQLETACAYPLAKPLSPSQECASTNGTEPWCQDPATGQYGSTEYLGHAFPGTRQLTVLRDIGPQAVVASICAKITGGDPQAPDRGYNPAMRALVKKLANVLAP